MRVSLFLTCINDTVSPEAGIATVRLIERLGHEVVFHAEQTCCGQMHFNTGYHAEALQLARRFVRVFGDDETVVTPSASCAGMVRHSYRYLAEQHDDSRLADAVAMLAPRVSELTEFLVGRLGLEDVGAAFPHRVTYHPTCHSLRMLRVGDAPVRLLRAVHGIDFVELPHAAECCGFGGTFAIANWETSSAILADKVRNVLATGAEACTAVDSSCLLQIGGALSRQQTGVRTLHLAEILAEERR